MKVASACHYSVGFIFRDPEREYFECIMCSFLLSTLECWYCSDGTKFHVTEDRM